MRLSKPDAVDPTKRRHFEISIDSPFHILSCQATQANTSLPAYSSPNAMESGNSSYECGCPGAPRRRNSPTSFVPTLNSLNTNLNNGRAAEPHPNDVPYSPGLARPSLAHINTNGPQRPAQPTQARPIHLLRAPSFNPPAFEDEEAPPPLVTPPPQYDSIASPTSGLSDYFARLSDAYDDDDGDMERSGSRGRVEVPLTPGSRVNRSMDVSPPNIHRRLDDADHFSDSTLVGTDCKLRTMRAMTISNSQNHDIMSSSNNYILLTNSDAFEV